MLTNALRRFGMPVAFVEMIRGIYTSRTFVTSDFGQKSEKKTQAAGIAQGCPLSPYLFIVVMSILLADVAHRLAEQRTTHVTKPYIVTEDLLYADDTLLAASDPQTLQLHFELLQEKAALTASS